MTLESISNVLLYMCGSGLWTACCEGTKEVLLSVVGAGFHVVSPGDCKWKMMFLVALKEIFFLPFVSFEMSAAQIHLGCNIF